MADRRSHRALSDIVALREAQHGAAQVELAAAHQREREAEDAAERADRRVQVAAQAWQTHLSGTDFAPEFSQALAARLLAQEGVREEAQTHSARMTGARGEAETAWQDADARRRLAERTLEDSRRALRRERDERLLAAQADRTISRWRRA